MEPLLCLYALVLISKMWSPSSIVMLKTFFFLLFSQVAIVYFLIIIIIVKINDNEKMCEHGHIHNVDK